MLYPQCANVYVVKPDKRQTQICEYKKRPSRPKFVSNHNSIAPGIADIQHIWMGT